VRYFTDLTFEPDERLYHSVDMAWTQTFKGTDVEKEGLVLGGPYGLRMVYTYLLHFSKQPEMEAFNGLNLLYLRATQLSELVKKV
jgi:hypothetical protein